MNGFILESRTIMESAIWDKPPMYFKVWHYLLLMAQHADRNGLKRGQLFTSIDRIREACSYYVGYRKETPTKKEIYRILDWLRCPHEWDNEGDNERGMIVTTKGTHGILVTIVNYCIYQDPSSYEMDNERDENETRTGQREGDKGNNINKNDNNNKNEIYNPPIVPPTVKRERVFQKPTLDEVKDYCKSRRSPIDAEEFFDHYESNGWMVGGKSRMKDWKAAVRNWERRRRKETPEPTTKPGREVYSSEYWQEYDRQHKEHDTVVESGDWLPELRQPWMDPVFDTG